MNRQHKSTLLVTFFSIAALAAGDSPCWAAKLYLKHPVLSPSAIPCYFSAKRGKIQVHEEGEEGTFERPGLVPVGKRLQLLNTPTEKIARTWAEFLCKNLKNLDDVDFPSGKWPKIPGKNCTLKTVDAFIIGKGVFKNTAVVQAGWAVKDTSLADVRINAAALLEIDSDLIPLRILKVIGGLEDDGNTSGSARLEFVTHKEIVLMFDGYVSQWQIVLHKLQGEKDADLYEVK